MATCTVESTFTARAPDELSVRVGEQLWVTPADDNDGWGRAIRLSDNAEGLVPFTYIRCVAMDHRGTQHGECISTASQEVGSELDSWKSLQKAFRIKHGLPWDTPLGPASFAREMEAMTTSRGPQTTFLIPTLLPPIRGPRLTCGSHCEYLVPLGPERPAYSTYPPPYEEQFNAQRFVLMELMMLAKLTRLRPSFASAQASTTIRFTTLVLVHHL